MAPPSKSWVTISDSQVDADSPLDTTLMTGLRDNQIHLEEWLGLSYIAAQDHDHDGTNSASVTGAAAGSIDQTAIGASAVGQGELITAQGSVSVGSGAGALLTLPGGEYGFYPQLKNSTSSGTIDDAQFVSGTALGSTYLARIHLITDTTTIFAQHRYIQASPPYKIGNKTWGHFLFLLRRISDGVVVASYEAEDPCWAYNGNPINAKDSIARITEVPHPFCDYYGKDPAVDGLEIVLVDLSTTNTKKWIGDNRAVGKGILEDVGAVLTGKGKNKAFSDYDIPVIPNFTDRVKIITP